MSNLIELQSQIEKLQKQASDLKAKEFNSTVADIKAKMQAYGITIKDLSTGKSGGKGKGAKAPKVAKTGLAKPRKSKVAGVPVAPKFRGPNGETWSGRGLSPRWLSTLIAQGQKKEDFAI
ncbi:MAG: H-NS histone family protein [Burkholderiaceae bacterium]|nr:H-NS histone family protein [Burkholderiaceae bacterium]